MALKLPSTLQTELAASYRRSDNSLPHQRASPVCHFDTPLAAFGCWTSEIPKRLDVPITGNKLHPWECGFANESPAGQVLSPPVHSCPVPGTSPLTTSQFTFTR